MGSKPCSICSSQAKQAIDLCLVNGTSVRSAAHQFNLSPSSVQRHKKTCMKRILPALTAGVSVPAYQTPAEVAIAQQTVRSVAQRAGQLVDKMEALSERFEQTGDTTGIMKAAKEIREGLRLMAQLSGELGPNQTNIQINNTPSLTASKEYPILMGVLSRHPEIHNELAAALQEAGL